MAIYDVDGNAIIVSSGNFINVKDYGAKGNGTADDASAIQSALNAVRTDGGIVFFPTGTYKISTALIFYSNQTLWFENGATLLQGAEINNLLRSYNVSDVGNYDGVHDCIIYGATFDGGNYETNNTLVGIAHTKNIVFENCTFKNAYGSWHNLEINSSYNIKVINCKFEGLRKNADGGEMIQIDGAHDAGVYPWSGTSYDGTVSQYIDICGCMFSDNTISPAIGNHTNMAHKFVKIHDCVFEGLTSSRGAINFVSQMTNIDIYDNTFNGCTIGVGTSGATYYIHDNRFVDATTAISGSASVSHANMINGTYTA